MGDDVRATITWASLTELNPITILDFDFKTNFDISSALSKKHKAVLKSLANSLTKFQEQYESPDWKLITRVQDFEVLKQPQDSEDHIMVLAKGEMDHGVQSLLEVITNPNALTEIDRSVKTVNLLDKLPQQGSIIFT